MAVPGGTLTALASHGPIDADVFVDFETGADGDPITAAMMDACTHGLSGWSLAADGAVWLPRVATAGSQSLVGGVRVGATTYQDVGTRGFKLDAEGTSNHPYFAADLPAGLTAVSAGCHYMSTSTDLQNLSMALGITAWNTDYAVTHWTYVGGSPALHINANDSGPIVISPNVWYWVTTVYRSAGTIELSVYLASTGALVGTTSVASAGASTARSLVIGRVGSDTGRTATGQWYFDNVTVSYAGTFPLSPGQWGA